MKCESRKLLIEYSKKMIAAVEKYADRNGINRSQAFRKLIKVGLKASKKGGGK